MERIKFVIWGAGDRCKELTGYLGNDYIEAIIDENVLLQGILYNGIPVISKEIYLAKYRKYPVIITPLNAEKTIENYLKNHGIYWNFYYWGKTRTELGSFMTQVPKEELIKNYDTNTDIIIYGWNALSLVTYSFLQNKGFTCSLMLPNKTDLFIEDYIKNDLMIKITDKDSNISRKRIILTMEPSKEDEELFEQNVRQIETYYDITLKSELYYNPLLKKFHNIHKGNRCFVVATGPSLKISDLDKLYENHEICIGVNKIYKGFEKTNWRPDYYIAVDPSPITENKKNIFQCGTQAVFIGDLSWNLMECFTDCEKIYKWHVYNWWDDEHLPKFSGDFSKGSYWGTTITYDALQLAVYMGFSEIYLMGVDCCKYDTVENQHFVKNYSEKLGNIREKENSIAYTAARQYADSHGIQIYNASRGGKLEVFKRVDFDTLFWLN